MRLTARMRWASVHRPDHLSRSSASSRFVEAVADAIKGLDCIELGIDGAELAPDPLDMAVDGPIIDIDIVAIGDVEQLVARLHHPRALRKRLEDQEFGYSQADVAPVPQHFVSRRVH